MVTIFKTLSQTNTPFFKDIFFILERIKSGKSKEIVENVRNQPTKEIADKIKQTLPAICFSGTFSKRSDASIIEHSGYICLDFDKYENKELLFSDIKKINEDKYTFSSFISPSGNGIKVIVKTPKEKENHKLFFDALEKHFDNKHFDTTSKNISRICFESYDPDIYINKDSVIWTEKLENQQYDYRSKAPVIKLENENEIIKRLWSWFSKSHSMSKGGRNHSLFILVSAFSDYGISQVECNRFCYQFIENDFTQNEIDITIRSAYSKCKANFGMKYFEDNEKIKTISNQIKSGVSITDVRKENPNIDEIVLSDLKENITNDFFWSFTKRGILIDNFKYKTWLEGNGFYKYYPDGSDNFIFVRVTNNLIDNTTEVKIKDFVLSELLKINELKVYEFLAGNSKYFKDDYLNILNEIDIHFKEDTIDTAYIYFKNSAIEITKEGKKIIDYIDLDGFVWKKHIIDFDFTIDEVKDCDFSKFIELVSSKNEQRINSLTSTIGYLMHSFKTSANNKAVILNDETISENPNGGSGKGIFWNAISKVKRVSDIDGKQFSFDKTFNYQTVSVDTQLLVFDDVQKNFKFENLFSLITEGITLEKKNKDAVKRPVNKSPKILITTNYTIGGIGGSFERRKWELEFSSYFNDKHTPLREFGRMFFDEWNNAEWLKFYNYMLTCLQMYLINGLVKHDFKNLDVRKFIKETSHEFYEWTNEPENIRLDERLSKSMLLSVFFEEFPDLKKWLSNKKFSQWLENYAKFNNLEFEKGRNQLEGRWILFKK